MQLSDPELRVLRALNEQPPLRLTEIAAIAACAPQEADQLMFFLTAGGLAQETAGRFWPTSSGRWAVELSP